MRISIVFKNLLVIVLVSLLSLTTEAQEPSYLYHYCPNTINFTSDSPYGTNRGDLLLTLSGTRGKSFYNTTSGSRSPDKVYGLYLCRGDLSVDVCEQCVSFATRTINRNCSVEKVAVIWYDECLLRYSNENIFSVMAEELSVALLNTENVSEPGLFNRLLGDTMNDIATWAANKPSGDKKFATKEANFTSFQTLYTLAQCTPDLPNTECGRCLSMAVSLLPSCCSGKRGGRVLTPSCYVRYELYPFYNITAVTAPPPPEVEIQNNSNRRKILVASLLATTLGLATISSCAFFIWRRKKIQEDEETSQELQLLDLVGSRSGDAQTNQTFNEENVGRSQEFPSIPLDILDEATNHFSDKNKLGEGGFGPVYKGILADGKEIAVKRLSRTSGQGLLEFKNEVMLIARLQHKNLVRLIGCCLEKNEKLLVYEFMPNRSLDVFLFDSSLAAQLPWQKRFSIIKGIARGIMYLHEDSRLKIIHRDLKASNVLLDHEMNPKISDFGMARIFGGDQNEANTNRVVGTYGYMAPEYAMEGLFSIKSDVFSFGVLLLEIISGKKNNGFHLSEHGESLLTFAWKLWCKRQGMELIDQLIVESCVANEVLKCIHIGLLCVQTDPADRPTMSTVVVMLASTTITLPLPAEPALFIGRVVAEAESTQPTLDDRVHTVNEVTVSNLSPR